MPGVFAVFWPAVQTPLPWSLPKGFPPRSGRLLQGRALFHARQHPEVVREHLPVHRLLPVLESFGPQRPTQKAILSGKVPVEKLPEARKRALFFSRVNTYLSGPMLFGMLAPAHYGASNALTLLVAILLGLFAIWWAIKSSSKVGTSV